MGITGVSSYTFNTNKRLTGLASNMDTETLIKQAMQAETAKYTKILQNRQVSEWKVESYREITSTLQNFYKEYFDISATQKLKSADSFASYSASYAATNSTDYVSITPGASAKAGTYSITSMKAATTASTSILTKPVVMTEVLDSDVQNITSGNNNNQFSITMNGTTKTFTLNAVGTYTTVQQFQAELQNEINNAFGNGKLTVGFTSNASNTGGSLSFTAASSSDIFKIETTANSANTALGISTAKSSNLVSLQKPVEGLDVLDTDVQNINAANDNNTFVFTFNNVTKELKLNGSNYVAGFQAELQTKLDDAFGSGKIIVGFNPNGTGTGGKLSFSTLRDTDSFSIGTAYSDGADELFSTKPTKDSPFIVDYSNDKFELTIDGVTKTVKVAQNTYEDANTLASAIQAAAITAFGSSVEVNFIGITGKVTFASAKTVSIAKTEIDANSALGIQTFNMSSKLDLTKKIDEIKEGFTTPLIASGTGDDIEFTINGKYFRFNSKNVSLNDIMKTVNADTTINATIKYDITTNSFKVESKNTGDAAKVTVEDKTGNLMSVLGVVGTDNGTDASVTVDGTTIVRPSNSFTYDGLTFNIKNDFESGAGVDPIKVTVSSDANKAFDFVKSFVDKYNEVIKKLNDKLSEKRYKDYLPLTDEQESAMSEEQIKKWNEKAKAGLLRNDSIISNILSQFRSAIYAAVEGAGIKLTSIGITTSSNYEDKGKLVIDETKLKDALATKPEEIARLFTSSSSITYYQAINSSNGSKLRSQRYAESGIANRFSDIIQDAIRTSTDIGGYKGSLLEKAGIVGDRSETKSVLAKEILRYDDEAYEMNKKLIAKENALYEKYAAMESALNKLNSQQSWIAQQFGGQ